MLRSILSMFILGLVAANAYAEGDLPEEAEAPLSCPHCGTWSITSDHSGGATGEQIMVTNHSLEIPGCGQFRIEEATTEMTVSDGFRNYRSRLVMRLNAPGFSCEAEPGELLNLDVDLSSILRTDAARADFTVSRAGSPQPLFHATAWNFDRYSPCDTGSAYGSVACLSFFNARDYKALAYEAYQAAASRGTERHDFNPAHFARDSLSFCEKREAESGGGSWPFFWALDCQSEILHAKLKEFREWKMCISSQDRKSCRRPTEKFERKARQDD